jgi:hypothetical protein
MIQNLRQFANEQRWNAIYWDRRRRHRPALPTLTPRDAALVGGLERDGGIVTSLDALGVPGTEAMLAEGDALHRAIAARPPSGKGGFGITAEADEIARHPALLGWGLDERLLAIAENYIGLPVVYRGLTLRRDTAGGAKVETRLLHRDNEDNRILKIIVYLNDVDARGGPFEFISRRLTPASWRLPHEGSRTADDAMARLVPPEQWTCCTGKRGTAVFTDTCRVYHRGRVAETEDRLTLFFCYNSASPMSPQWCAPLFDVAGYLAGNPTLTAAQRAAITPPYR